MQTVWAPLNERRDGILLVSTSLSVLAYYCIRMTLASIVSLDLSPGMMDALI